LVHFDSGGFNGKLQLRLKVIAPAAVLGVGALTGALWLGWILGELTSLL
jgi:hypothetical protein